MTNLTFIINLKRESNDRKSVFPNYCVVRFLQEFTVIKELMGSWNGSQKGAPENEDIEFMESNTQYVLTLNPENSLIFI
jgi:hypothetical protein